MARSSSPRPNDNDCLRLPATSSPRIRGAEKKESTGLRLNQPCPQYVTPSSISSGGRRLSGVRTAENKSLKSRRTNRFCQSSDKTQPAFSNHPHLRPLGTASFVGDGGDTPFHSIGSDFAWCAHAAHCVWC